MQDERKKLLGKVHIAKKDLGLDDDTYRRLLKMLPAGKALPNVPFAS